MSKNHTELARHEAIGRVRVACERFVASRGEPLADLSIEYISGYRRTFVFRASITTSKSTIVLFVKAGRDLSDSVLEFVKKEATMTSEVTRRFPTSAHLAVAKLEIYYPDLAVIATRAIDGVRLDRELVASLRSRSASRFGRSVEAAERCGEWLRKFQQCWPRDGVIDVNDMLTGLNRHLDSITGTRPDLMDDGRGNLIRKAAEKLASQLTPGDRACVTRHDDFAPWNVMHNQDGIVVFDFPNVQAGPVHYDMYQFDSALETLRAKLLVPRKPLQEIRIHFRRSFDRCADDSPPRNRFYAMRFGLVRLGALLHLHKTRFPRSLLRKYRINAELAGLVAISRAVDQ